MVVQLKPLEFTDCVTDSPSFRENLHAHERELRKTSNQIKRLIKEVKDLINAAKHLSRAQRNLSVSLQNFSFECIGTTQTDDELVITKSLAEFGRLIAAIEDERDRMLDRADEQIIIPLENFRKEHIGGVKEGRKKFEKQTAKFCQSQERYLNLSTKKQDSVLQEADATLEMEQRHFCQASLEYVFLLQEVQERKKFEFVETLLSFMFGWLTFYHQGHEVAEDFKPYMRELQFRIQKTRDNFNATRDKTESLMKKMLELRQMKPTDPIKLNKNYAREGYLYLLEKKALIGTITWTKHYCMYQRENKEFVIISYNQMSGKSNSIEKITVSSCVRRMSDSIDKRFCFDITSDDKPGVIYTFQALSEEDRKSWLDIMDGKEPTYGVPVTNKTPKTEERQLDEMGFAFVAKCIEVLETRGLHEQGLYRVVGVSSKVNKLLTMGLDRRKGGDKLNLDDSQEWETKTITSALKTYLRTLNEPVMTFKHHSSFILAAKQESRTNRINHVHYLLHQLPQQNFNMLDMLIKHLNNVVAHSDKNLMTVSNVGVCFGPTLLRPEEETVAAIMDIKFCNVVVEILIENYLQIFKTAPEIDTIESSPVISESVSQHYGEQTSQQHHQSSSLSTMTTSTQPLPLPLHQQGYANVASTSPQSHSQSSASIANIKHGAGMRQMTMLQASNAPTLTHAVIRPYCNTGGGMLSISSSLQNICAVGNTAIRDRKDLSTCIYPNSSAYNVDQSRDNISSSFGTSTIPLQNKSYHSSSKDISNHRMAISVSGGNLMDSGASASTNSLQQTIGNLRTSNAGYNGGLKTYQHGTNKSSSTAYMSVSSSNANSVSSSRQSPMGLAPSIAADGSSESISSLAYEFKDLGHHDDANFSQGVIPQKSKRNPSMSIHYASNYKPYDSVQVRTLYACLGENDGELSFEPNQIITNVRSSMEPGWLEGTLNGKTGLVPENYVEILP